MRRAAEGRLHVVDSLGVEEPSTKAAVGLLERLGVDRSALVVTGAPDRTALLSTRNIPGVRAVPADVLNVADMLAHRSLVLTVDAVRRAEALWGGERASGRAVGDSAAVEV